MSIGTFALVLHAHLPFVRHPEHEHMMEEDWYFEALLETYLPLLDAFLRLRADGVDYRVTVSLSAPLLAMLEDELLLTRFERWLGLRIELAAREVDRHRDHGHLRYLATKYRDMFSGYRDLFYRYDRRLVRAFADLQVSGEVEVITTTATHIFAPHADRNWAALRAQVELGAQTYERCFGHRPLGMWLGECGYVPGIDELLAESGVRYTLVDTHGVLNGEPRPIYGVFAPIVTRHGVAIFGRDPESTKQVWSRNEGYPGDPEYRDFYRDIGFDAPYDYVAPYIHPDGIRCFTGIKYHRITGPKAELGAKHLYNWDVARDRAAEHAGNFMFNREKQIEWLAGNMDRPPIVVSPYDAELFGHWWFEGPWFIEFLFRKMFHDQRTIEPTTLGAYLGAHPRNQIATPSTSSWGYKGYGEFWCNGANDWIYRHLHTMGTRMVELAHNVVNPDPIGRRALNQAARELLLAQASDWAFIMKTGTTVPYATRRTTDHVNRFNALYESLTAGEIDLQLLEDLEGETTIFPEIDYRIYAT